MKTDTMKKQNRLLDTKTVWLNKLGLNVRYAELGDSKHPPILLMHGVPENLQAWYDVAPLLAEKYHVLAFDWPGFGGSDPPAIAQGLYVTQLCRGHCRLHGLLADPSRDPDGHRHCFTAGAIGRPGASGQGVKAGSDGRHSISTATVLLLGAQKFC